MANSMPKALFYFPFSLFPFLAWVYGTIDYDSLLMHRIELDIHIYAIIPYAHNQRIHKLTNNPRSMLAFTFANKY